MFYTIHLLYNSLLQEILCYVLENVFFKLSTTLRFKISQSQIFGQILLFLGRLSNTQCSYNFNLNNCAFPRRYCIFHFPLLVLYIVDLHSLKKKNEIMLLNILSTFIPVKKCKTIFFYCLISCDFMLLIFKHNTCKLLLIITIVYQVLKLNFPSYQTTFCFDCCILM